MAEVQCQFLECVHNDGQYNCALEVVWLDKNAQCGLAETEKEEG